MSLFILSEKFEAQECTFKNVAYASLKARLQFYTLDISLKASESIEVWIRKQFGNGENDYESFSMDIHGQNWIEKSLSTFIFKGQKYISLAGTDNTPASLCYYFSLAYLRLKPLHKIALDEDCIFGLEEIEIVESLRGYTEDWAKFIGK